jgi:hypothetical protein
MKTYYSKQHNTSIILFEWLLTLTRIEIKTLLLKSFELFADTNDKRIAIIMEQQLAELEDTFWKESLPDDFVIRHTHDNSSEKELLVCKIQILDMYSTKYLEEFSNSELFDLYIECRNKQQWNIRISINNVRNNESKDCGICLESVTNNSIVTYNCNHEFCNVCVRKYFDSCCKTGTQPICAFCRTNITHCIKHEQQNI